MDLVLLELKKTDDNYFLMGCQKVTMDLSLCTSMSENNKAMVQAGIDAVTAAEMWDWLKTYEPDESKGFMDSDHPNLDKINDRMNSLYGDHSGSSYCWTMLQLEFIAKNGFDAYVDMVNGPPPRAPTPIPRPISLIHNRANTGGAMPRRVCMCRSREGFTEGWCSFASMGQVPGCEY